MLYLNPLTGSLPVELCDMTQLTQLYLDDCQFSGTLPTQLGLLESLQIM